MWHFVHLTAISCPDPGFPINGRRNGTTTKFGDIITFSCNDGYKLVGSAQIECVASKSWFGNIPTCEGNFLYSNKDMPQCSRTGWESTNASSIGPILTQFWCIMSCLWKQDHMWCKHVFNSHISLSCCLITGFKITNCSYAVNSIVPAEGLVPIQRWQYSVDHLHTQIFKV